MSIVLGIDLGTTNSAMAYVVGGKPTIVENAEGARTTPSVFNYNSKDSSVVIGEVAKRNSVLNPENTFYEIKRFIGRKFEDPSIQEDVNLMPFKVLEKNGKIKIANKDGKEYASEEISAAVLRKLKTDAEAKLGQGISEAVITVPAYFNDAQRQATKDAGEIAGLKVLRIINEPTAAALAYGFDKNKEEKILVYDLGGGTFDVTVLDISEETIEVMATNGDTHLGGKDFDKALVKYIIEEFRKESGVDISKDKAAIQRIKEASEKAKHDLSTQQEHQVNLPFITMDQNNQPQHLMVTITRAKLESLVKDLAERTIQPVKKALADSGLDKSQINQIIMVGGMTRMPLIQKSVEEFFGKKPNLTVNPDEVVAMGAAIQGAVLKGDVKDILLLDVTPLTLAIETYGGVATPMINRNTTVPASKSQIFSTAADNQPSVDVHVVQGERPIAVDNKSLGKFTLSGIAPAPKGVPQIEVVFDIDANGILTVKASDKGTGKTANITITGASTLSEEEKEKAIKEAKEQEEADKLKKDKVEAKNKAENIAYQTESLLKDMGDKLSDTEKADLESIKNKLQEMAKDDNTDKQTLESETEKLQSKLMEVGKKVYSQSNTAPNQDQQDPNTQAQDVEPKDEPKNQPKDEAESDKSQAQDVESKEK
jgi:molecular chaperone DnaK